MKVIPSLVILGIFFVAFSKGTLHGFTKAPSTKNNTQTDICNDDTTEKYLIKLRSKLFKFASSYLTKELRRNPNKSTNFSPSQISYLLAFFAKYASEDTRYQILRALDVDTTDGITCPFLKIKDSADASTGIFYSSNIFANLKYNFTKSAQKQIHTLTDGKIINVDFNDKKTVTYINKVVEKDTNNEVSDVVSTEDILSNDINMALISAIKLQATFPFGVNIKNITNRPYHMKPNETTVLPFYYIETVFNYTLSKTLCSTIVEVPFQDPFYGWFFLPNEGVDIKYVAKKMKCNKFFEIVAKDLKPGLLQASFPVFKNIVTKVYSMKVVQENLQVPSLFDSNKAKFDGLVEDNKNISVSYGIQKCIFEAIFENKKDSIPKPKHLKPVQVNFQRPYLYVFFVKNIPMITGYKVEP